MDVQAQNELYVLFFIELGTRRVYLAGVTAHPDGRWVAQQAKQMVWTLEEDGADIRFLIHDNDGKFTAPFDTVFQSAGLRIIHTPFQAPNANAVAERWVRSVRDTRQHQSNIPQLAEYKIPCPADVVRAQRRYDHSCMSRLNYRHAV